MMGGQMMRAMTGAMSGATPLMLHMMLGWLLVLLGLLSLVTAALTRRTSATVFASVSLASIVVAGFAGLRFVTTGHDALSFLMATAFVVSVGGYFGEVYALR